MDSNATEGTFMRTIYTTSSDLCPRCPPQCVNSSTPSATYKRQWIGSTLVGIMVCRVFGSTHYLNQCWPIVNWTLRTNFSENTFENVVCQIGGHLSGGRWVILGFIRDFFTHILFSVTQVTLRQQWNKPKSVGNKSRDSLGKMIKPQRNKAPQPSS